MSEAGCNDDRPRAGPEEQEPEPETLWQVGEIRFAALAGVLLAAGYAAGWAGVPAPVTLTLKAAALAAGGWTFVPGTLRRLANRKVGVGTLMTIAAAGAVLLGEVGEAAMLAFLYAIAEGLEEYSLARTRRGLRALLDLVPAQATVLRDGNQRQVAPAELRLGEVMVVRPGERVATDGIIRAGRTSLDLSAITGESMPVEAGVGDEVFAGAINGTGVLEVQVTT
ncbi:MAG: heavy metal translocating P-type ATPase, partial [Natronosporangium sp.]